MTRYNDMAPRDARRAATQTLALAKWLLKQADALAKPLEEEAKAWLAENDLDPGSKIPALIDGDDVATISRSKLSTRRTITVDDEQALGKWLQVNKPDLGDPWEMRLKDWAKNTTMLGDLIEADGEVPDGVSVHTSVAGGGVRVLQSESQREALEHHINALRAITDTFDALAEITDGGEAA